ncbi:MAG: alpha/beta hydrolase [Actinomycetota bacterium]|nr:alpha/beta hydrolase [Actinomycetota bacterium]
MAPWRPIAALLASTALLAGCSTLASFSYESHPPEPRGPLPTASGPLANYYNQDVDWHSCGDADCATLTVPMDYEDPAGRTVELAMLRVPATGESYGTLFVNPGGPGGSAADYARAADYIASSSIREHYDIVGVDPRGVANSDPVQCLTGEQVDGFIEADGTPDSAAEEQEAIETSSEIGQLCAEEADEIYAHMGTVDAARDMDIARAAVGDEKLTYLGKSYGTMLGQTYAQLFPGNVGRMVLDGALPTSLDIVETSKGQADAFEVALRDFVSYCLGQQYCPVAGTVDEAVAQLRDWLSALDAAPLYDGDRIMNEPVAMFAILSYLYFPPYDYQELMPALASAMQDGDPKPLLNLLDARISRNPDGTYADNSTDAFYAVSCLDRPFTGTVEDVRRYAEEWAVSSPTFGEGLAWGLLPCKDWPATAEALADTSAEGAAPILVVSTRNDPATPYQWGVQMAEELPGAALLTWEGYQHTAYTQGSDCIDDAVDAYLLDGTLPAEGTICE